MSKKPADTDAADTPKKRSKLKLALFGAIPLVLAGGAYGGWMFFAGGTNEAAAHTAEAAAEHGEPEPAKAAAIPYEIVAESSFTHSYALSVLLKGTCGATRARALKAASDEEAGADGMLAHMSWQAAARRAAALTEKSCDHVRAEIFDAETKAAQLAAAKAAPQKPAHH